MMKHHEKSPLEIELEALHKAEVRAELGLDESSQPSTPTLGELLDELCDESMLDQPTPKQATKRRKKRRHTYLRLVGGKK